MTTPSGAPSEDDFWRRPAPDQPTGGPDEVPPGEPGPARPGSAFAVGRPGATAQPDRAGQPGAASGYPGPPPTTPPPPGWRPPVHLQPAPPRQLPPQDMTAMDMAEQRAQRLTYGLGTAAGVVLVILLCLLCSRAIF